MYKPFFFWAIIAVLTLSACATRLETIVSPSQTAVIHVPTATPPAPIFTSTFIPWTPTAILTTVSSSSANCSSLRSIDGSISTAITFVNWSGGAVNVYWVDYQGLEKFWFEIPPGHSQKQETYVTHAWCVRDEMSDEALLSVVATQNEQVATVLREIQWQESVPIPNPSSAPFDSLRNQQLVFHNNHVYVLGGRNARDERLTDVYFSALKPDGTLGEWKETTRLPGKYYDHVVVRVGDYIYMLTGADGTEDVYFASFSADGSLGAWKQTVALSPSRQTFAAASYGNFIYVTGGNSGGTRTFVQYTSVNPDGSLDAWSYTRPLPKAVQEHTTFAYDGHLYVLGGRNASNQLNTTSYFSAIQPNGSLGEWKTTSPLPEMQDFATLESDGYVYLFGRGSSYYTRILENHNFDQWQTITLLPAARNGLRVGANNGYAYAIGGYDFSGHQSTVYQGWIGMAVKQPDCTSGWTRLRVGSYAKVSQDNPSPNRVRESPDIRSRIIYQIYPDSIVSVSEGPVCTDGLIFWKVENSLIPGGVGWTAEGDGQEYYLEPIP